MAPRENSLMPVTTWKLSNSKSHRTAQSTSHTTAINTAATTKNRSSPKTSTKRLRSNSQPRSQEIRLLGLIRSQTQRPRSIQNARLPKTSPIKSSSSHFQPVAKKCWPALRSMRTALSFATTRRCSTNKRACSQTLRSSSLSTF